MNRGDVDALLEQVHPEIEWTSQLKQELEGGDTAYRGREELRTFWEEWVSVWNPVVEEREVRDLGDTVLALASLKIEGQGSGVGLEREIAYVIEFEDGLVRRARSYLDPDKAVKAVESH